jgi:hypothetical protein
MIPPLTQLTILDLLVMILAADAVLVAWFKGSLFNGLRARVEAWSDSTSFVKAFFGELLTCPICLPLHLAIWITFFYLDFPIIVRLLSHSSGLSHYVYLAMFAISVIIKMIVQILAVYAGANRLYNGFRYTNIQ